MSSIVIRNVQFGYKTEVPVLKDVNITIEKHMFPLAIVGPNGSGKTTLLKNIVGILTPQTGEIWVEGHNIHKVPSRKRASIVGVLFPDRAYPASVSVIDVVMSGAFKEMLPWEGYSQEVKRQAYEVMDMLGIRHLSSRMFSHLSSGERQLVLTAMVMVQSPKVILLDEPTSFLDPYHRYALVDVIKLLSQNHKVIFTSHDIEFVKAVAPFSVGIKDGKIIYKGETHEFLQLAFGKVFGISFDEYIGVFGL